MLQLRRTKTRSNTQLNMAAMIDVVFLLLIFFMCTTQFEKIEKILPAKLPLQQAAPAASRELPPIRIQLDGTQNRLSMTCDQQACATFADLDRMLQARREIADIPVIIAGREKVPFQYMVRVMDICYQQNFTRVAFSTR